ncbi:hypothetical protein [Megalodesulfovibrio gigas]|uniref:Sulfotransferase family protein n=1 Tax=Megalodesulfovibrio gigas (strain ATCC 19364 / DSM 1382 / NCIMB 9332 / VKM B-1759) TaxID=1121448 RepID=T2GF92_MEGG1|nr:hypothetical protein [Megalodesulfovibrio gigas]AGW15250.1 hypothetical protein DGI_4038 [Megalodesulfovibrio gigas DSM 1382 = ATCC 19364]
MAYNVNNIVIILGMHRSGTSTLAGCLHLLGMDLGDMIMQATPDNATGYFENIDIYAVHERLFAELGHSWDVVGELPRNWMTAEATKQAAAELEHILETQFIGKPSWAIKDPRICRLMPLWNSVLSKLQLNPNYILVIRDPIEVARSLQKRDGMNIGRACLLWAMHNIESIQGMAGHPNAITSYDQLLYDPIAVLKNFATHFNMDFFKNPSAISKILQFVQPSLKHNRVAKRPEGEGFDFQPYSNMYRVFQKWQLSTQLAIGNAPDQGTATVSAQYNLDDLVLCPRIEIDAAGQNDAAASKDMPIIRDALSVLGEYERAERKQNRAKKIQELFSTGSGQALSLQLYFPLDSEKGGTHVEKFSQKVYLAPDEWKEISIDIPFSTHLRTNGLRIDPLNQCGTVFISAIELVDPSSGQILWEAREAAQFSLLKVNAQLIVTSLDNPFSLASIGSDPQLLLPSLPALPDVPVRLRMWIKAQRTLSELWKHATRQAQERSKIGATAQKLQVELEQAHKIIEEAKAQQAKMETLQANLTQAQKTIDNYKTKQAEQEKDAAIKDAKLQKVLAELAQASASLEEEKAQRLAIEHEAAQWSSTMAPGLIRIIGDLAKFLRIDKENDPQHSEIIKKIISDVKQLGLIDEEWYLNTHQDVKKSGLDPVEHFILHGATEQRRYRTTGHHLGAVSKLSQPNEA